METTLTEGRANNCYFGTYRGYDLDVWRLCRVAGTENWHWTVQSPSGIYVAAGDEPTRDRAEAEALHAVDVEVR